MKNQAGEWVDILRVFAPLCVGAGAVYLAYGSAMMHAHEEEKGAVLLAIIPGTIAAVVTWLIVSWMLGISLRLQRQMELERLAGEKAPAAPTEPPPET